MTRAPWDFEYLPLSHGYGAPAEERDFVVATRARASLSDLGAALGPGVHLECLLERAPLFWYRARTETPIFGERLRERLARFDVRYVASARSGSMALGLPADFDGATVAEPREWKARTARVYREGAHSGGRWFLGEDGVHVDRAVCGTGAGTRVAIIDDDARDVAALGLDACVLVGIEERSSGSAHGDLMVGWIVGTQAKKPVEGFTGVAPDASPRLYLMPRPGRGLMWLPLAIVRAVDDGADVVHCAANIDGTNSPMLDDALELASRLGRRGLGSAVVFPTGREISSAEHSTHASLTLGLGDPASDPRVLCVAPSGRDGGWFLWSDRRGRTKPFANRGPSVRAAAPGDDMGYPFADEDLMIHAESSGASAVASGVALLVLSSNPDLEVGELYAILTRTASVPPGPPTDVVLSDPADVLPRGRDPDGHDAKCGYGRLSALRACLVAADPFAACLVAMGEEDAARRFIARRRASVGPVLPYSDALGRWAARIVFRDGALSHSIRALLRHCRLVTGHEDRLEAQVPGALTRALVVVLRALAARGVPEALRGELSSIIHALLERPWTQALAAEKACFELVAETWAAPAASPRPRPSRGNLGGYSPLARATVPRRLE